MIPRSQRRGRIAYLRFRLRLASARLRFNAWATEHHADEWIMCGLLGGVLGALLAWGF